MKYIDGFWFETARGLAPLDGELVIVCLNNGKAYTCAMREGAIWKDVTHWARIPPLKKEPESR